MSCIDISHLTKSYGSTKAVNDITLSIKQGQIFGFLGPNGAGKSTLIKLLTTLITPSNGSIYIMGIDAVSNSLQVRHKIGVVLQKPSYEPTLSVEKSLEKYGMMWNVPKIIRKERMEQLLQDFDLDKIRKKRNEDLSIGQRRRVQVAREFMHDIKLLFLDEPTVGLDPSARRRLLDYLKNKALCGMTIFYTTHILSEVEYLCDEIAIINEGKIVTVNTPDMLKSKFTKGKIIKIYLSKTRSEICSLLSHVPDCKIDLNNDPAIITIHSMKSELILFQVLKILNDNNIDIKDLSAVPISLEEIFLNIVRRDAPNN